MRRLISPGTHARCPVRDGLRRELRVGEPQLNDVPLPPSALLRRFRDVDSRSSQLPRLSRRCSTARPTIWTCTSSTTCRTTLRRHDCEESAARQFSPALTPVAPGFRQVEEHVVDGQLKTLLVHRKARSCSPFACRCELTGARNIPGCYACLPTAPPAHPSRLPVHRAARADRRHHGASTCTPALLGGGLTCRSRLSRGRAATCSPAPTRACKRRSAAPATAPAAQGAETARATSWITRRATRFSLVRTPLTFRVRRRCSPR